MVYFLLFVSGVVLTIWLIVRALRGSSSSGIGISGRISGGVRSFFGSIASFGSIRKWLYGAGFVLLLLFYPTIIDWMAPHLADTPAFQSWNLDEQWIEANYEWVGLVLVGSALFFFWFFPGEGNAISNRFFFGVIFTALALQIVPDQYKSFASGPDCDFTDRIGFERGLHHLAPEFFGRKGDADEWVDPLPNIDPRILDDPVGVVATICPGDSSYVMVAPGTHLEIDFTDGFAKDNPNVRTKSQVGEGRGRFIGEFVQVEYIPSNNGDPVFRLYRVHVNDRKFGKDTGTGHDSIRVNLRAVPDW